MKAALVIFLLTAGLSTSLSAHADWTNRSLTVRYETSNGNSDKSNVWCQFMTFMFRKVCHVEGSQDGASVTLQVGWEDIRLHDFKTASLPDFLNATLHMEFADTTLPASEQPEKDRYRNVFTSICDSLALPLRRKCEMSDVEVLISNKDGSRLVSYVADGLISTKDGRFIPARTP